VLDLDRRAGVVAGGRAGRGDGGRDQVDGQGLEAEQRPGGREGVASSSRPGSGSSAAGAARRPAACDIDMPSTRRRSRNRITARSWSE
jgi:hypothetical protein